MLEDLNLLKDVSLIQNCKLDMQTSMLSFRIYKERVQTLKVNRNDARNGVVRVEFISVY